jgi:acetyl esterase/lipase
MTNTQTILRCVVFAAMASTLIACSSPPSAVIPDASAVRAGQTNPQEFAIFKGVPPGSEDWTQKPNEVSLLGNHFVYNVIRPTLTAYFPDPKKANGMVVIVAPGGGFKFLNIDSEGADVAKWLADHGIVALVLKYRTEKMPNGTIDFLIAFKKFVGDLAAKMEKGKTGTPMSCGRS